MADLDLGTLRAHVELDDAQFDKKYKDVTRLVETLDKATPEVQVGADASKAEKAVDEVERALKRVADADVVAQVDAAIEKAESNLGRVAADLRALEALSPSPEVSADISKAESALSKAEAELDALKGARAEMVVDADTSAAEDAIGDLPAEGEKAGEGAGAGMAGKIIAALATIPVAGAIIGIGAAIGSALMSGLENEVRADRFAAQTGLDDATTARIGRAAGEAYANNFGESIAANIDVARVAIQAGLLDPQATKNDAQQVIQSLTGVADVLEEDIGTTARAVGVMMRTGIAKDSQAAFDILVRGAQTGANASEDLLDTFTEYPALFQRLGLSGEEALGLINQGLEGGARNSDLVADALKELQIRATDGSKLSAEGYRAIGLSAEEMTAKMAAGGEGAREGLDQILDGLRAMEDPQARNAAGVALIGTQWEDLGDAILNLDVSTAVGKLGQVEGAAQSALDTLGDNTAGKIESAKRNIEVAADGIKGALATAFSPQIEGFATFVSTNREAVLMFLLDAANGAIDFGRAVVDGAAAGTEAFGDFLSGPVAELISALADIAMGFEEALPGDQGGNQFRAWADDTIRGLEDTEESLDGVADNMRTNLIQNALDPAQQKLNEMAIPMVAEAALNDATGRLAAGIEQVGYVAGSTTEKLGGFDLANLNASASGQALDAQVRAVTTSLGEQLFAAKTNGEGQDQLRARVDNARVAFVNQMTQMGLTGDEANALADKYGLIPGNVDTLISAQTGGANRNVDGLQANIDAINDKSVTITVSAAIQQSVRTAQDIIASMASVSARVGVGGEFDGGGWTGDMAPHHVAGVVHGQEFVVRAGPAAANRAVLEAMNAGASLPVPGYAGGGFVGSPPPAPAAPSVTVNPRVSLAGAQVVVRIGSRDFDGYIADVADSRVAANEESQDRAAPYAGGY
ncbi:phage tail tape measure protein [Cellulosimicrobium sp. Marseille-Q8652]